ncbi:MAG: helix-turn-helix transcriptional regulator, partial [Cyanothece sp. SIO1E1]|nr:helix-turn-helix transcriptional regulator [Cyanothece sp. SIO1E1]
MIRLSSQAEDNAKVENAGPEVVCKPEQILRGAMQVFLEGGYAGTSMDRVAA